MLTQVPDSIWDITVSHIIVEGVGFPSNYKDQIYSMSKIEIHVSFD